MKKFYDEKVGGGMPPLPHVTPVGEEPQTPVANTGEQTTAAAGGEDAADPGEGDTEPPLVAPVAETAVADVQEIPPIGSDDVELSEEAVKEILSEASRRHSFFSGFTIAASASLIQHDPDSLSEYALGVDAAMQSRIDRLQRHLMAKNQRERQQAEPPKMSATPDGGEADEDDGITRGSEQGDSRKNDEPVRKSRPKPRPKPSK